MGLFLWRDPFPPGEHRRTGSATFTPKDIQLQFTTVQRRLWVADICTHKHTYTQLKAIWEQEEEYGQLQSGTLRLANIVVEHGDRSFRLHAHVKGRLSPTDLLLSLSHQRARPRSSLCSPRHSTAPSSKYPFVSSLTKGKRSNSPCLTFLHERKPHVSSQTQTQGPNPQTGNSLHKNHTVFCHVS
jgi:hypothetical protein